MTYNQDMFLVRPEPLPLQQVGADGVHKSYLD